jgi:adenylate cyclase
MLMSADLAQLRWQRTRLFENLSSYLSGSAAKDVALSDSTDTVTGTQVPVTVMSINLRNFDRFCASQEASLSARLLHDYLSLLNDVVQKAGGELEHVQGAEVLAVWREGQKDSVATGVDGVHEDELLGVTQNLWKQSQAWLKVWSEEHKSEIALGPVDDFIDLMGKAEDPIRMGVELELEVGLEQGVALIGSVGPKARRVYTVLGEPVQVAQSLRGMCSELAYPVLLGPVFGAHFGVQPSQDWAAQSKSGVDHSPKVASVKLQSTGSQKGSKLTQVVHMTPVRLGEFLLPGTLQAKLVFALPVEFNVNRLHLVNTVSLTQHVA